MRLASAIGIVALALSGAACRTAGLPKSGDIELEAKLVKLGVEGKTYTNDLSQVAAIRVAKVYVIGDDFLIEDLQGHLTYVDGATLNPRWEYFGLPRVFDKAPDYTPSAVIGLAGGKLFVINRSNGTTDIEPRHVDVVPSGAPVATDTTIYVPTFPTPSGNKTIYAISIGSGFMGWGWRTNSDVVGAMAKGGPGAGDEFYFATSDGVLYAFPTYPAGAATTDIGWTTNLHGVVLNDIVVEGNDIGVVMQDGRLVCADRITGAVRWEAYSTSSEQAVGSASFSSKYAFYRCGGELRAFARDTGNKVWSVKGAHSFVAERGGRMLLAGNDGTLISVDKKTGQELGRADAKGWTFPTRITPDSTVYGVSEHGTLVAIESGF
jgi:outer membrane protein assembly factor BamB